MNRSFWEFISDCNFSKSACQVDVTYFNLLQIGYKHYHIKQYKEEFIEVKVKAAGLVAGLIAGLDASSKYNNHKTNCWPFPLFPLHNATNDIRR